MKNFKFSLAPLLRLKEVEKRKIEIELANHQTIVKQHTEQIQLELQSIKDMLEQAEFEVSKNHRSSCLFSQPQILDVKKKNIYRLENSLKELYLKRDEILHRLNRKSNELKKVEEEMVKQEKAYARKLDKIEQNNLEEMYSILRERKKPGASL